MTHNSPAPPPPQFLEVPILEGDAVAGPSASRQMPARMMHELRLRILQRLGEKMKRKPAFSLD